MLTVLQLIEYLNTLDAILEALAVDSSTYSTFTARVSKAQEGHAILAAIRSGSDLPPMLAKLNQPLPQLPTAKVSHAPKGGLATE